MSIINKMLQDLDRRQGRSDPDAAQAMPQVRSVPPARTDREWFWRIIAVLMVAAVGWVAWIAWQLQPREPIATEQAFKAAQNAQRIAPAAPAAMAAPAPVEQKPAAQIPESKPAPEVVAAAEPAAVPPIEAVKPAPKSEIPARERPARPAPNVAAGETAKPPAPMRSLNLDVPPARILQAPSQNSGKVERRDRVRQPDDRAEAEFRRGVALLNQGRGGEAEEAFHAALAAYPQHEPARQALVATYLEQRRLEEARKLLQEGVVLNPANARFASVLARILVERRDYATALTVVTGVQGPAQGDGELQAIRGSILQRLGRHGEAVEAFQNALRAGSQSGALWLNLATSLEASGRKAEAAEAFRRAAASGTLSAESREYAEQRARQLQ